jgi:plasmid stabilization system protein ParE
MLALLADPGRRTATDYGLRYWPVERYPYVVFYDLTDTEVIVLGVMHTSQQPEKWISRRE